MYSVDEIQNDYCNLLVGKYCPSVESSIFVLLRVHKEVSTVIDKIVCDVGSFLYGNHWLQINIINIDDKT